MKKENPFRVNFTVGIWKKDFLRKITPKQCSVWQAEREGIEESRKYSDRVYAVSNDCIGFVHAIMSAGWTRQARDFFRKEKLEKTKYNKRKNKPWYIYCKDIVYGIMAAIAPKFLMYLTRELGIGRK